VYLGGLQEDIQVAMGKDRAHEGAYRGAALCMHGTWMHSDVPVCVRLQPSQEKDRAFL
jgi:hypothetical protein